MCDIYNSTSVNSNGNPGFMQSYSKQSDIVIPDLSDITKHNTSTAPDQLGWPDSLKTPFALQKKPIIVERDEK